MFKEISIRQVEKEEREGLNQDLQWLSDSLGLSSPRDKEKSCFRIFLELVKAKKEDRLISSDEIAFNSHLTRGTVIHHLNKLGDRGLIITYRKRYTLSSKNIQSLMSEIESNINSTMKDLKEIAKKIDKELGL